MESKCQCKGSYRAWITTIFVTHEGVYDIEAQNKFCAMFNTVQHLCAGEITGSPDHWIKYIRYGLELSPETGELHYQCAFQTKDKHRKSTVINHMKEVIGKQVHVEHMHGTWLDNVAYTSKSESNFLGYEERGPHPWKETMELSELCLMARTVTPMEMADKHPEVYWKHWRSYDHMHNTIQQGAPRYKRNIDVKVYYGPTGTGKTETIWSIVGDRTDVFVWNRDTSNNWMDRYTDQRILIMDEYGHDNTVGINELKLMLDPQGSYTCKRRGLAPIQAKWDMVLMTSQMHPDAWYPGSSPEDRDALRRRLTTVTHMDVRYEPSMPSTSPTPPHPDIWVGPGTVPCPGGP